MTITTQPKHIRRSELQSLAEGGGKPSFVVAPPIGNDEVVLEGRLRFLEVRQGLTLHSTDACDLRDLHIETIQPNGITIFVFIEGGARAQFGTRTIEMGTLPHRQIGGPEAIAIPRTRSELFRRHSMPGMWVKKVNVSITPEWLEAGGFLEDPDYRHVRDFAGRHLKCLRWRPSFRLVSITNDILQGSPYSGILERLFLESRAIDFVTEALSAISGHSDTDARELTAEVSRKRANAVRDYIDAHLDKSITLEALAREVGMSANTVGRHFREEHGKTVFEYIKDKKMEKARSALLEGMSISQTAHLAGYASPANFATAFKKYFGVSPKQARL